ncbi:MAG: DUF1849 family protein [Proteobacteria bacterium]|nr:DUF1849 family protein [Pseudomonadota bacterium]
MRSIRFAVLLAAALFSGSVAEAQTVAPHRAAYSLSLGDAKGGSVGAIEGALVIDWGEVCEGWTISQRMRFTMSGGDGGDVDSDISFSSFESHDGRSYRFSLRTSRDGDVVEELRGRATLDPDAGGKAEFSMPETTLVLPPGTMFPTAHSLLLINLAEGGERLVTRAVFDGATLDGALDVSAIIGDKTPADPALAKSSPKVGARPSWRVRMAYFNPDDKTGTPTYETSMRMLDNAVASEYSFDYPEFSIRAKLERLEALPKPNC